MVGLKAAYFAIYPIYGSASSYKIAFRFSLEKLHAQYIVYLINNPEAKLWVHLLYCYEITLLLTYPYSSFETSCIVP